MAYQLHLFDMPWYYLLITFIVVVGVINAYNFMDGINGITACYSLAAGGLLMLVNHQISFIDQDLLAFTLLGVLVFTFFNFRTKAKCFAGDVGAVAIAYILLFVLGTLIIETGNLIYILFLSVYGIDAVWTIVRRLSRKENIFEAHRSHLYQYLGNEAGFNKLLISFLYAFVQIIIGLIVIQFSVLDVSVQVIFSISLLAFLSAIYLAIKISVINKYVKVYFMLAELQFIKGGVAKDERGQIRFVNDFDMSLVKRFYMIKNADTALVRGWRGHRIEQRWFYVLSGAFEIELVKIDNWESPSLDLPIENLEMNVYDQKVFIDYANLNRQIYCTQES